MTTKTNKRDSVPLMVFRRRAVAVNRNRSAGSPCGNGQWYENVEELMKEISVSAASAPWEYDEEYAVYTLAGFKKYHKRVEVQIEDMEPIDVEETK